MKISTLYDSDKANVHLSTLKEGVKFGSRQKDILQKYEKMLRIGIEYEFHIDEEYGGDQEEEVDREYAEQLEVDLLEDELDDILEPLVTFVYVMGQWWDSWDTLDEVIDDAKGEGKEEKVDTTVLDKGLAALQTLKTEVSDISDSSTFRDIDEDVWDAFDKSIPLLLIAQGNTMDLFRNNVLDTMSGLRDSLQIVFEFVDQFDNAFKTTIARKMQEEYMNSQWAMDELRSNVENRIDQLMQDASSQDEFLIHLVASDLEDSSISDNIFDVVEESSIEHGVEVITKPLSLAATTVTMAWMFKYINKMGSTSDRTGMHINISTDEFREKDIDLLKVMTLMDTDFFQNMSTSSRTEKAIDKWNHRNSMVDPNSKNLDPHALYKIANAYVRNGVKGLEEESRKALIRPLKYKAVNWTSMFNASGNSRRIEFRFFGGENYQNRMSDIMNDLMLISYILIVSSRKSHTQDHLKGLVKILDRASKKELDMDFTALIDEERNKIQSGE